jgi:putative FmdB family regulatory protein
MPIYEYRCDACGHQEEFLQKVSDKPLSLCPKCGKRKLKKLLSAAGFQLKGSGWYATDFKGGKKAAEKTTEAAAETKTEAKSEAKGDAKPDQKSNSKPATTTN